MASAPDRSGCLIRLLPLALLLAGGAVLSRMADGPDRPVPTVKLGAADFVLTPEREPGLMAQLGVGDQAWVPRAEPIPGGGTRYVYKRRSDDPPLSLEQIKALMRDPPSFAAERTAICLLLTQMRHVGVTVLLGPPRKQGAAGEWDPARAVLRIRPDVPAKGSREFARVLNHEAIHVAQSCRRGSMTAQPQLLGLSRHVQGDALQHLSEPLYRNSTPLERALEEEAYAHQDNLRLGLQLLRTHCLQG